MYYVQVQYMKIASLEHGENMLCTDIVLNVKNNFCTQQVFTQNMLCAEIVSDIQNNFCTQHFLPMFCKNKTS